MKTYAFRLEPGQDLRQEIDNFVASKHIKAGIILTCVGNLQKAVIRMADASITKTYDDTFEITSLVGTVESGNSHLHITLTDKEGHAFGGHLKMGSVVGITAEVVLLELDKMTFKRELDKRTGYEELVVQEEV